MPGFPTMATDGRRLVYNPGFVEKLTPAELEGVLAHEVLHCALVHHCRRGERDAQLWNQATDYAINPILISNGITLPKDALIDPALADLGAEEIYARLRKQGQESGAAQPPSQSSSQPASAGVAVTAQSRLPKALDQRHNHPNSNRKTNPSYRDYRIKRLQCGPAASARCWMRSARTTSLHRRQS